MDWNAILDKEKQKPYFSILMASVAARRQEVNVFPPHEQVFSALSATALDKVKCVILGQDPYHGARQAHGLAFSVPGKERIPPSLRNIFKELAQEYPEYQIPAHGDLSFWADQGVLLLNTVLTVEEGKAHSHARLGWETLTDALMDAINLYTRNTVFMLWGGHAQKKGARLNAQSHCILTAAHPSPLSAYRGFFGCNHFRQANTYLIDKGKVPIDWQTS